MQKRLSDIFSKKNIAAVLPFVVIALLSGVIYSNALTGDFMRDDVWFIKDNPHIKSFIFLPEIFSLKPTMKVAGVFWGYQRAYYRPLPFFTYMVDYSVWGLDPRGYHLANVLLHITISLCVFVFMSRLTGRRTASFAGALLFAVHPVQTSAVNHIDDRSNLLAVFFMLLFLLEYVRISSQPAKRIERSDLFSISMFYLLGLLSREMAFMLVPLALLYNIIYKKPIKTKLALCVILISVLYLALRLHMGSGGTDLSFIRTIPERLPGVFVALFMYLKQLVFPFKLHLGFFKESFVFSEPFAIAGMASFTVMLMALIYSLVKIKTLSGKVASFGILWFFITFVPISNLYPISFSVSNNYVYLPSIGLFLIAGWFLSLLIEKKTTLKPAIVLTSAVIVVLSSITYRYNPLWKDELTFLTASYIDAPDNPYIAHNLGTVYLSRGDYNRALDLYWEAIDKGMTHPTPYYNIGVTYCLMNEHERSLPFFRKALIMRPGYDEARTKLEVVTNYLRRSGIPVIDLPLGDEDAAILKEKAKHAAH